MIEKEKSKCLLIQGDLKDEKFCKPALQETIEKFVGLNVVINNAAVQFPKFN